MRVDDHLGFAQVGYGVQRDVQHGPPAGHRGGGNEDQHNRAIVCAPIYDSVDHGCGVFPARAVERRRLSESTRKVAAETTRSPASTPFTISTRLSYRHPVSTARGSKRPSPRST